MNFSDSEIVASIMTDNNYVPVADIKQADVIFVNTCSIRDNAEQRVLKRLKEFQHLRKKKPHLIIGVLGCMAERMKESLLEEKELGMRIDMVIGPDAYRDIPSLLTNLGSDHKAFNVILSTEETYADITPVRYASNGVSAFISIMRGCENFCSYCVVPYTRGKERSRNPHTIVDEAKQLFNKGYREVTLLGQNVNSYHWKNESEANEIHFAQLIKMVADVDPLLRVRFATSHPKDMGDELLHTIADNPNICKAIHLPAQSGSSQVLTKMNRKYTREWYMNRIEAIKTIIPDCAISTDIIAGFCSETDDDHNQTLSLMEWVAYDYAYMFKYSERPGTAASKKFADDIPEDVKTRRLEQIIALQGKLSLKSNKKDIGKEFEVLVEGTSKRNPNHLSGRTSHNKVVVFESKGQKPGDYVWVKIHNCTAATLMGALIDK